MDNKDRWNYHALVGVHPTVRNPALGVYSAGAGYRLTKAAKREVFVTGQLSLAKNRLNNFLWAHAGFQFWFRGKKYKASLSNDR
jgi:hypothetical protein